MKRKTHLIHQFNPKLYMETNNFLIKNEWIVEQTVIQHVDNFPVGRNQNEEDDKIKSQFYLVDVSTQQGANGLDKLPHASPKEE